MVMKKRSIILLTVNALILFAFGLGSASAKEVIKIGLTISTTGKYPFDPLG